MRHAIALAVLALTVPAAAQETVSLPDDYTPPAADLAQMDWLVGRWQGPGIGGNLSLESWLPRTGDTMVGTFVQTEEGGGIQFTEHMYLMEHEGSLVLRLKHFNADLTGWEDAQGMVTFRLVDLEPCRARFGGLTIRCNDEDGLLVAVRMRSSEGAVSELLFDYARAD